MTSRIPWSLVVGIGIAALLFCMPVGMASGAPGPVTVQQQIDAHLRAYPGGEQINANEISYNDGAFVITFTRPVGAFAAPDCPSGYYCYYDGINYTYPRGRLASCAWQDLAWTGWNDRTESVHFNKASGAVSFLNHGSVPSHDSDRVLFTVNTSVRLRSDVAPYRNMADHVRPTC
jgi:hypothetical protein